MQPDKIKQSIAAVILAAGSSSRLGQPKQLVQVQGHALLSRTIDAFDACQGLSKIVVVLGENDELIRNRIHISTTDGHIEYIKNTEWEAGMGSSISFGIDHLKKYFPDLSAAIISVCDQPFLKTVVIQNLIEKSREFPGKIIASRYSGTDGPPVLFPASWFDRLSGMSGDRGAKYLIREFPNKVIPVDFAQGAVDIDTPADLDRFRS